MDYSWTDNRMIAHALGGMEDKAYMNCKEGLETAYENGFRIFETDLHLTEEGNLVLYHDAKSWFQMADVNGLNYSEFKNTLLYDTYHTMDLQDLIVFMDEHNDMYVLVDWGAPEKNEDLFWYAGIVYFGLKYDGVLDRIILEINSPLMHQNANSLYEWKSFTLAYYDDQWSSVEEAISFCKKNGIKVVDLPANMCNEEFVQLWVREGIMVYCYTVNDVNTVSEMAGFGVNGCFTDFLIPEQ